MSEEIERARLLLKTLPDEASEWNNPQFLADWLYTHWFHCDSNFKRLFPNFVAYRAAHAFSTVFEPGWRVERMRPDAGIGAVTVERDGIRRLVQPPDYAPALAHRLSVGLGDPVLLTERIDELHNGFWHLWSTAWQRKPPGRLIRLYFRVTPDRETAFVKRFSATAPNERAWCMKILSDVHFAGRSDVAVLYLDHEQGIGVEWLSDVIACVAPLLNVGGPPLTAPIAPGISWAEDPGQGVSFGEDRCRLLATAACDEPEALNSVASWQQAVLQVFAKEGLDSAQPHLQHSKHRSVTYAI